MNNNNSLEQTQPEQGLQSNIQSIQPPLQYAENSTNDYRQSHQLEADTASLRNTDNVYTDSMRNTDNVSKQEPTQKTGICAHRDCNNSFIKTVSWKKYCCDECRIAENEKRTGLKLRKKARGRS